jgi:uncharacterized membrane protein YfcA
MLLGLVVGLVLGLLGGGGSILTLPIFLYVFHVPPKSAIAMSLVVVAMSAFVGFVTHLRQGTVNLRIAVSFGALAMAGAFASARAARFVPTSVQLGLFAVFALSAALLMLRDSTRALRCAAPDPPTAGSAVAPRRAGPAAALPAAHTAALRFSPLLGVQAVAVGVLTALMGAGGGFLIFPALVLMGNVPVKEAVGSSLLIIAMNASSGVAGYLGQVPFDWPLVTSFSGVAAIGAITGTRLIRHLSAARIKQAFAIMILVLGTYLVIRRLTQ